MDLEQIRFDTIGCRDKIFLNSAGSSLMPTGVVEAMQRYLKEEQLYGGYEVAKNECAAINEFYLETARLINCRPENIAFAYNATDAYSKALSAIVFLKGDYILTTNDDYISNQLAFISLQKRFGIQLLRTKNLPNGDIDFNDFEQLVLAYKPKLVALTHIPTNSGLIQDAEKVGEICSRHNILYLVDACQSVGQIAVDVSKIKCDFLSATGRKFLRGPRGTGFLYISDRVIEEKLEPLFIDMQGARWTGVEAYDIQMNGKRFEEWEFSYASLIGLTAAVRYTNVVGIENIQTRNAALSGKLRSNLQKIAGLQVLDKGSKVSSIVTFHMAGIGLEKLCELLKKKEVRHSVTYKEHALIDLTNKGVDWVIRLSPHYFNTFDEIEAITNILTEISSIR
jgi:cysteine desulfurase / selenocysteine lyase